jgi:hypothetical protein
MVNAQAEIKRGYSLTIVFFLDKADNWLDFFNGIETFLVMGSQLNWLEDYRDIPVNPSVK